LPQERPRGRNREMFDQNFDPYEALVNMDRNLNNVIQAHNNLARLVEEQQQAIDVLIKGMNAANKANQILMKDALTTMNDKLKDMR
jgi:hypothetical protein